MFETRLLKIALFLVIPLTACTPTQKPRTPAELPAQDQFQAVIHDYPAVGAYLIETDAVLEILDEHHTLGLDALQLDPEGAARIRESLRLAQCLRTGLKTCPRFECTTPAEQCESEPSCETELDEARRAACQVREAICRTSTSFKCRILLVEN